MRRGALALWLCACSSAGLSAPTADFPSVPMATAISSSGALRVDVRTSPEQPPTHGVLAVELTVTDASTGAPVDGLVVTATPWMPAHGHGASVVPTTEARGRGHYTLSNVALYMPGTWEIRTELSGDGKDQVDVSLEVR